MSDQFVAHYRKFFVEMAIAEHELIIEMLTFLPMENISKIAKCKGNEKFGVQWDLKADILKSKS